MPRRGPVFKHAMPLPGENAMTHELKVGDTIMVDGHEFVIVSYDMKVASNGRSCSLTSLDPILAETERIREEEYRESERKRHELVAKTVKHIDEHHHEGED